MQHNFTMQHNFAMAKNFAMQINKPQRELKTNIVGIDVIAYLERETHIARRARSLLRAAT